MADMNSTVEVCLSPRLFPVIATRAPFTVVVVDILRATTSICAAFECGAARILPVAGPREARAWKARGYEVVSEKNGVKPDFADYGNSALSFTRESVEGKTLVFCTTNGTRALKAAAGKSASVVAGSFSNLSALTAWLTVRKDPVVILCSGWKGRFCLEDALFAGALSERLVREGQFGTTCDSVHSSVGLWQNRGDDLTAFLGKADHYRRLRSLGLDDVIPFTFTPDTTRAVPVLQGEYLIDVHSKSYPYA